MRYIVDTPLGFFNFWGGARNHAELLTASEMDILEQYLEEYSSEVLLTETAINDFFWFDLDFIAELLGYKDEEELYEELQNRKREKEN